MSLDDLIWISIDDLICIMSLDGLVPSLGGGIATHKNLHQIAILVTKALHFRAHIHDAFFIARSFALGPSFEPHIPCNRNTNHFKKKMRRRRNFFETYKLLENVTDQTRLVLPRRNTLGQC